jgi:hypothetical protein
MYVRHILSLALALGFCGTAANTFRFIAPAFAFPAQMPTEHTSTSSAKDRLGDQSKLQLVRYVSGEYAKVVLPLPRGNDGFVYHLDKSLDTAKLHDIVRTHGAAVNTGDKVQITHLDFESKRIVVEINGGGKHHFHLREHLQIGMGGSTAPVGSTAHPGEGTGSTLVLDYGKPLPEMSPDDLKKQLSPLLDFSNQTSATVAWIDTVPAEFRKSIEAHEAAVGMDQDMVIAALGRPERKVREKDPQGLDTEDWIYGDPPAKTTFVTFSAGKVVRVKEFND